MDFHSRLHTGDAMKKTTLKIMLAATLLAAACGKKDGSLKIAGSDTMVQLGQTWRARIWKRTPASRPQYRAAAAVPVSQRC
jgi:ABC-type phosphate transport system substrate-binding protein